MIGRQTPGAGFLSEKNKKYIGKQNVIIIIKEYNQIDKLVIPLLCTSM